MGQMIKRKGGDFGIDFDALEEIIGDMVDNMEIPDVDLTAPMKVGFTFYLDTHGCVKISEYGIMNEKNVREKRATPLTEVFEFGDCVTAVVELNGLSSKDFDVKLLDSELLVMSRLPRKIIRRFELPCKVEKESLKTEFNNNVLEISVKKKQAEFSQTMKK